MRDVSAVASFRQEGKIHLLNEGGPPTDVLHGYPKHYPKVVPLLVFAPRQAIQIRPLTSTRPDVRVHCHRRWEARRVFDTAKYLHYPLGCRWLRLRAGGKLFCLHLDEFLKTW